MLNAFKHVGMRITPICMLEIKTSILLLISFGHNSFVGNYILLHEQSGESEF